MDKFSDYIDLYQKYISFSTFLLVIGKSVKNAPIFALHFGKFDKPQILLTAATHAREYVSTAVGFEMISSCRFENIGVWFVPVVNPDGVKIVLEENKKMFKANANLVDINVNFDANWGKGKSNVFVPNFENFVGPYPNSEIETKTLANFAKHLRPALVLNLHTKGEVIYFGDFLKGNNKGKDQELAKKLSNLTGFYTQKTSESFGGFSDFCEMRLNIPALTLELGNDSLTHPILLSQTQQLFSPVRDVLKMFDSQHWSEQTQ